MVLRLEGHAGDGFEAEEFRAGISCFILVVMPIGG